MEQNTSYKKMLRDRCPKTVNLALKWCKAKEKWLNHVYKNHIWILSNKKERLNQTKAILGITESQEGFSFYSTIDWDNLTEAETKYWQNVNTMVKFFLLYFAKMKNTYNNYKANGNSEIDCKRMIITNFLLRFCPTIEDSEEEKARKSKEVNDLSDFIIDCINNNI